MKVLILSILVAVCYAQTPPPKPKIPETFMAKVEVFLHEHETYQGSGIIARDEAKNEGVENIHSVEEGRNESRIVLQRYDIGEEYYIRGSGDQEHCEVKKVNGTTIPPFWGWLEYAKYMGQRDVRGMVMDVWGFEAGRVRIELLVSPDNANLPRYLNDESGVIRTEITFLSFDAVEPSATVFVVPDVCKA